MVGRLRAFHRERLNELDLLDRYGATATTDPRAAEAAGRHALLLDTLERQTRHIAARARLIRSTLVCLVSTIGCLAACSLFSGLSVLFPPAAALAGGLFFAGTVLLLVAVVLAMLELRRALDPLELESRALAGMAPAGDAPGEMTPKDIE